MRGALAGLLTSGIIPAMRHCMHNILADDAILLPAAATVYMQVISVKVFLTLLLSL